MELTIIMYTNYACTPILLDMGFMIAPPCFKITNSAPYGGPLTNFVIDEVDDS